MTDWLGRLERRPGAATPVILAHEIPFRLGLLLIEPALRRISTDDGREAILQPRTMQVLVFFRRTRGQIVARDDLTQSCWSGAVVGEDSINRVISQLRRLAEDFAENSFSIETIKKVGYRLRETVAVPASPIDPRGPIARKRSGRNVIIAALAMTIAAIICFTFLLDSHQPKITLAVEPFSAVDKAQRGTALRLTDDFLRQLAASHSPAQKAPATLVARAAILSGPGENRLALRLDDALTGTTIWRNTAPLAANDPTLDTATASLLADTVSCALHNLEQGPGASDLITAGMVLRQCDAKHGKVPPDAALDNARRLAARAPDLWTSQLAVAEAAGYVLLSSADADKALRQEGVAAADRAIALVPSAADPYWAKAILISPDRPLEREALLRKSIASQFINCTCGLQFLGDFLLQSGRAEEALSMYQRGTETEGGHLQFHWRMFMAATLAGQDELAQTEFVELERLEGSSGSRMLSNAGLLRANYQGDAATALKLASEQPSNARVLAQRATYAAVLSGDARSRQRALMALDRLPEDFVGEQTKLPAFVLLGDNARALALLERSRSRGGLFSAPGRVPGVTQPLLWGPSLAPLWRDHRFVDYLGRAGFLAYWRGSKSKPDICKTRSRPPFCDSI